jgi:hypothetical protein
MNQSVADILMIKCQDYGIKECNPYEEPIKALTELTKETNL